MIAYCSIPGAPKDSFNKVFTYHHDSLNFKPYESKDGTTNHANGSTNVTVDARGGVYAITVDLIPANKSKKSSYREHVHFTRNGKNIHLRIAKAICFKELLSPNNQM